MQSISKVYKFSYIVLLLQTLAALHPVNASEGQGADDRYLRLITTTCLTCHSAGNGKAAAIPRLDGLSAAEIKQLLNAYKSDRERGTIMNRISKALTGAEIDGISAMFGSEAR